MTLILNGGGVYLPGGRDKDGYRTWNVKHQVLSDVPIGPSTALQCPGLPQPGQMWLFTDDVDAYAYCTLEAKVSPAESNSNKHKIWWIEQPFSSAPNTKWCKDQQIDDPLLQPPKISGNFIRFSEEATTDRFGSFLQNSSWEQIRGPQVEFDADRIQIEIEQNVINLDLPLLIALCNSVNAFILWGAAPRVIKFTPGAWSLNYFGQCHRYFTRKLIFEANKNGWDRTLLDEGTKVLAGDWDPDRFGPAIWNLRIIDGKPPNPKNPQHFIRFKDRNGENSKTVLDGAGKPFIPELVTVVTDCTASPKAPSKWLLSGLVNDDLFQSPIILEHTTKCTWTAEWEYTMGQFKTVTLVYAPPSKGIDEEESDIYVLTITGADGYWKLKKSRWKPLGPNTMENNNMFMPDLFDFNAQVYPAKLGLTTGNVPGVRTIQKYEEADFLQLGIPINL